MLYAVLASGLFLVKLQYIRFPKSNVSHAAYFSQGSAIFFLTLLDYLCESLSGVSVMELGLYSLPLLSLIEKPASGNCAQFLCPLGTLLHGYVLDSKEEERNKEKAS